MIEFLLGFCVGFAFYPAFNRWVKPVLIPYLDRKLKEKKEAWENKAD